MNLRERVYKIIFEADTKAGRYFDIVLLWIIVFSVILVFWESVPEYGSRFAETFQILEWIVTIIFSVEYILRIIVSRRPLNYIFSFWGFVDFLAILPTYLSLVLVGYHYLVVIRIFRLLRVFRILKLVKFIKESEILYSALRASSYKISIFLLAVTTVVISMGTVMYVIEGGRNGFDSIPNSIYWAVITVTTVGYGDVIPHTFFGKLVSSVVMIIGYAIIAVPTGIITVEMSRASAGKMICSQCSHTNINESNFCNRCGNKLR